MADFAQLVLSAETKGLKQAEPALDAMVVKAGKAEAAAKRLTAETRALGDGAAQGATGLKKTAAALDEVEAEARVAESALERTSQAAKGVGTGMSAGSHQSRMMAQQLSQVAQQASATGNWVQALAIQLPDMALGFGAVGIAAGVLASVTLPLLAQMLGSSASQAEALADSTEALQAATEAYVAAVERQGASITELGEKYGALATVAAEALRAQTAAAEAAAIEALAAKADLLAGSLGNLESVVLRGPRGQITTYIESFSALRAEFGLTEEQASRVYGALQNLASAEGPVQTADAARALRSELEGAFGTASQMPAPIAQLYAELNNAVIEAANLQGGLDEAHGAAQAVEAMAAQINSTLASADGSALVGAFQAAFPVASQLLGMAQGIIATLNAARANAAQMQFDRGNKQYSGRGGDPRQFDGTGPQAFVPSADVIKAANQMMNPSSGGGGGRSAAAAEAEKEAQAIQKVVDNLKAEIEQVGASEQARRLHQELQKAGVTIYSEEGQAIAALVEDLTELEAKQKLVAETMKGIENAAQGFFVGVLSGAKDLQSAIGDLLKQLGNLFLNQAFKMLWEGKPGGSGGLGGLFAGLFDMGGRIPAGQVGLVAEKRPEIVDGRLVTRPTLVAGPAKVTGGADTARMMGVPRPQVADRMRSPMMSAPAPRVTVTPPPVVVLDDPRKIDAWQRSPQGERTAAWQKRRMGNG